MSSLVVDSTTYQMPHDEYTAQKVASYNSVLEALNTAWSSWTPTWTNLSVGNGTVVAKYRQIGKLVFCRVSLIFGSTTTVSGLIEFSFPVTSVAYAGTVGTPLGVARLYDTSASALYPGQILRISTTLGGVVIGGAGTYVNEVLTAATVPFTWATGDEIVCQFFYEAA